MALEHSDLFFVNRNASTYKIEAHEIGDYLTTNPRPGGTDYFVNDGELSVKNSGNVSFNGPYLLTSANTSLNTAIDFDENFTVNKAGSGADITVAINFSELKSNLLCDFRNDACGSESGFATDNCDCLALDFDFISNRLPCNNGGIVDDNGCMQFNYCTDGLLEIQSKQDGCVDVKVCNQAGIDTSGGCLAIDMDFVTENIVCVDGGLVEGQGGCIEIDYDKVKADMGLGVLTSVDNSITFKNSDGSTSGDLTRGNVDLSVNPTVIGNPNNPGGNVTIFDMIPDKGIAFSGGAGGNVSRGNVEIKVDLCRNSGLTFEKRDPSDPDNKECLKLEQIDDSGCWSDTSKAFTAQRLYVAKSGGALDPGIVLGTRNAANDAAQLEKWWIGMGANQNNGGINLSTGRGWNDYENCGGKPPTSPDEIADPKTGSFGGFFSVAVGYKVKPQHTTCGLLGTKGTPVVAFIDCNKYQCGNKADGSVNYDGSCGPDHPQWHLLEPIMWDENGNGTEVLTQPGSLGSRPREKKLYEEKFHGDMNPYNEAGGRYDHFETGIDSERIGRLNRLAFNKNSNFVNDFPEVSIADSRVAMGSTEEERLTTIENLIEQVGKFNVDGGLVRSSLKTDDVSPDYPTLYLDANELASIAPSLVEYQYSGNIFHREFDEDGQMILEEERSDLSDVNVVVTNIRYESITLLSMIAHRIRKKQVEELQTKLDALEARLDAAGIP